MSPVCWHTNSTVTIEGWRWRWRCRLRHSGAHLFGLNPEFNLRHAGPGVEVEVVVPPAAAAPRIADAEELAPLQLFQQYAESKGLVPEVCP
jgi:hypothetical protein